MKFDEYISNEEKRLISDLKNKSRMEIDQIIPKKEKRICLSLICERCSTKIHEGRLCDICRDDLYG